jgi:predicted transposase YdaD
MDHDHSYKLLFSHAAMVEDLLRGFVREDWVAELDFATLERAGNGYVSDDLRERIDDIVWRLRFRGEWLYVYLLIEFQSSVDAFMAVRLLAYVGLLYQDLLRAGQLTAAGKLPPVLPVVLYNGRPRWDAAVDIAELIEAAPGGLERYRPSLRYLLIDEGRYAESDLAPLRNLAAALFRLENSRTPQDVEKVLEALVEWLKTPEQTSLRRAFTHWLKRVFLKGRMPGVSFENLTELHEVKNMLEQQVIEWTEEWFKQGEAKGEAKGEARGRQKGHQEGEAALLQRLLERRYGPLNESQRLRLQTADADTLLRWGERIFQAASVDEVLSDAAEA